VGEEKSDESLEGQMSVCEELGHSLGVFLDLSFSGAADRRRRLFSSAKYGERFPSHCALLLIIGLGKQN